MNRRRGPVYLYRVRWRDGATEELPGAWIADALRRRYGLHGWRLDHLHSVHRLR